MISKFKLFSLGLLMLGALALVSCNNDDDDMPQPDPMDITEVLQNNPEYSSLYAALDEAGLLSALQGAGPFTLFAPDNDAFADLLAALGAGSVADIDDDLLEAVLLYHVVGGNNPSSGLSTQYVPTLSPSAVEATNEIDLFINTDGGVAVNGIDVTDPDISASNGVIHGIEEVLLLPTLVDFVTDNPDFSSLGAALAAATTDFISVLEGDGPFTVFAPNNAAFQALLDSNDDWNELGDIRSTLLDSVLSYHVVQGANVLSGTLTQDQEITTLLGETLTVDLTGGGAALIDRYGQTVAVLAADVQANNGVVHVVENVLLPIDGPPNIVEWASDNPNYSLLVDAVIKADLVDALSGDDPLTVFAPDNDAFTAFLAAAGFANLDAVPVDVLTSILLYHVVPGAVLSTDLETGYVKSVSPSAAQEEGEDPSNMDLFINTEDGVTINGGPMVEAPDIEVTNGVIHGIDAVIGLPTLVTFATSNPEFAPLVAALTAADLDGDPDFVDVLSGDGPFTVFAPTTQAFTDLLTTLGVTGVGGIDGQLLEQVLLYHVVSGNILAGELTDGAEVATLLGDDDTDPKLTVNLQTDPVSLEDATGGSSGIIATDVQAYNGVVHVINRVLLPATP